MKSLLKTISNWKILLPALLGFIYCVYEFQEAQTKMSALAGEEVVMMDVRDGYTLDETMGFFTAIKQDGRQIHEHATGVIDMLFPFAYGVLFIGLAAFFLKRITGPNSNWLYLSLIPVLLIIFDYIENFNTLNLLKSYPDLTSEMVDSASRITVFKSMLTSVSMALPLVLGLIYALIWVRGKMKG